MTYMIINFSFQLFKIGLWMSGVQPWVMVQCMNSFSFSPYTKQRIDMLNVNVTLKHGLKNFNEKST